MKKQICLNGLSSAQRTVDDIMVRVQEPVGRNEIEGLGLNESATALRKDAIESAIEHFCEMQKKYSFQNDVDSVGEAIRETSDLSRLELTDAEISVASDRALEAGPRHLQQR